jgi:putative membrane protein
MNSKKKYYIAIALILSSYLFGTICIQLGVWPYLANFTWFQMLLSAGLLFWIEDDRDKIKLFQFFIPSYLIGYMVEVLGINTGVIFGNYEYGKALGVKLFDTPLMIGVNWFILCYVANDLLDRLKLPKLLHLLLAAALITATDYIIEPDAIRHNMWNWFGEDVPLKNYIAWYIVSLVIGVFYLWIKPSNSRLSFVLYACMLIFFLLR